MRFSLVAISAALTACGAPDVTLYVALDQQHSERLIDQFEQQSGLDVQPRFDSEANKTVGLVSAIVEEAQAGRPRCDVFWNNELAQTVRLAQMNLLAPYESPAAAGIPAQFKDPQHRWTGFAARARVLIVNKELIPDPADYPKSMWDLTDPKWKGKCAVARPVTGTTLTHFTALRSVLGEQKFDEWLTGLERNQVVLLTSNGATMKETAAGKIAFAFTDTDDYHVALRKGHPVACVFPDQGEGQVGTMLIPNSVAIIAGGPHPEAARKLVDWIVSEQTEALLAAAQSAQIPLHPGVRGPEEPSILKLGAFRLMAWDPVATAENLAAMTDVFTKRF